MKRIGQDRPPVHEQRSTGSDPSGASDDPWQPSAANEVRRIRAAVTSREAQPSVSDEMAPMMSEFLARLDGFVEPPPLVHSRPQLRDDPPSPVEMADEIRGAIESIESSEFGARLREDGPVAQMLVEARDYLELRRQCIARASRSAT